MDICMEQEIGKIVGVLYNRSNNLIVGVRLTMEKVL